MVVSNLIRRNIDRSLFKSLKLMKKEILIIHETLKGGGAEKVLIDILNHIDYDRYNLTLLLIFNAGIYKDQIPKEVKVLTMFSEKLSLVHYFCAKFSLYKCRNTYFKYLLLRLLKGLQFDATVSFMEGYSCVMHSLILDKGKRNISWVHTNLAINNWCLNAFQSIEEQRQIYEKMDDVVFVSQGARDAFNEIFNTQRSTIVHNLIDVTQIIQKSLLKSISKRKFTVVNVSRLVQQKYQERIIEIASILKKRGRDIDYWILGTGPRENELKELVRVNDLEDTVFFKGFQSNPYPYMRSADVFLLTSETEGYPLVICEALSLGKPIVSTEVTGTDELLSNDVGLLCNHNTCELADAIEKLYCTPSLRDSYSKKSHLKSLDFAVTNVMNRIYSVFHE